MGESRSVLAVFPHPDDETFGKAGTLALHVQQGCPVTLICATLGQMGRRMGKPVFANRETLPHIREQELRKACEAIGIRDLRLWRMRDKMLQFEDPEVLADRVYEVIQEIRPFRVFTFYPGHGVHPDHNAIGEATVRAVSRLPEDERPEIYASAISKNCREVLGPPDVTIDVSSVWERKLAAIRAHRSQSDVVTTEWDRLIAENPDKADEILAPQKVEYFWKYNKW